MASSITSAAPATAGVGSNENNDRSAASSSAATLTQTVTTVTTNAQQQQPEVLRLTLNNESRPSVRWESDVIDNEGLGRKVRKLFPNRFLF